MTTLDIHPAANLFPMMDEAALAELADDIKKNGLMERIVIHDGQILDGRNRLKACEMAGVTPLFTNPNGAITSPTIYVVSKNLHRRHLTISQRAAIAAEMLPMLQEEARHRQMSSLRNQPHSSSSRILEDDKGSRGSSEKAASALGISHWSVESANAVKKATPEVFEQIKKGEVTVNAAYERIRNKKANSAVIYEIKTERQRVLAQSQKKKLADAIATIGGLCHGIGGVDLRMAMSVITKDEVTELTSRAEEQSKVLRRLALRIKEEYGKYESSEDGKVAG